MKIEKKSIEQITEEYNKLHKIPADVTDSITHEEFVAGVQNHTHGFRVVGGEPIMLVKGARKSIFNILVMLYTVAPAVIIPFWAYHERNWWLLTGIVVASLISTQLAQLLGFSMGGLLLVACLVFWFSKGMHNYYTFFFFCGLWGCVFFEVADQVQTRYATQSLIESPELYNKATAENQIRVVCRRN